MRYLLFALMLLAPSLALASWDEWESQGGGTWSNQENIFPNQQGLLNPGTKNAYGPAINSDGTGRPYYWQPNTVPQSAPNPTLQIQPNAYGPGIGMDQYGRPTQPRGYGYGGSRRGYGYGY